MSDSPSFLKQLTGAALVMGALVGGLWYLGRTNQDPASPHAPEFSSDPREPGQARPSHAAYLIPSHAWLVVDFASTLVGERPFGDDEGPCAQVAAPARALLAVLPGATPSSEPSFLLAAIDVTPAFFACAEKKILAAGGARLPQRGGSQLISARSGLLAYDEVGTLLFSTALRTPEELLPLLGGRAQSVANAPPHQLDREWNGATSAPREFSHLLLTSLALPPNWLESFGPDVDRSPLVALRGARLTLLPSGTASGALRCDPRGCAALADFAERATADLLSELPPILQLRFRGAIRVVRPTASAPDSIGIEVSASGVELARAVAASWLEGGTRASTATPSDPDPSAGRPAPASPTRPSPARGSVGLPAPPDR